MTARRCFEEIGRSVLLSALAGMVFGFVLATGILDLIPTRHGWRFSYWHGMTAKEYRSNLLWYPVYGLAIGAVAGLALGIRKVVVQSREPSRIEAAGGQEPRQP